MKTLLLWFALFGFACADIQRVEVDEAAELVTEGIQILDVRTQKEWNQGHLPNAVRVDFLEEGFGEKVLKTLDPTKPVLIYCRSGNRSEKAAKLMERLGFTDLKELKPGILGWEKSDKQLVIPKDDSTPVTDS